MPVAAAIGWWRAPPLEAFPPGVEAWAEWSRALLGTSPLSWVVFPLRLLIGPALATGGAAFVAALPGALAVLALHVLWVFSSDAAFEELTLANVARLSARARAARSGVIPLSGRAGRRRSFRLRPHGRPETAIAWKALVRATRGISVPLVASGATFAIALAVAAVVGRGTRGGVAPLVAIMSLVFFTMSVFAAPMAFNGDLRRDAPHLELLRALPLRGTQVLAGEMAVPFLQSVAAQWALAALWFASAGGAPFPGTRADHAAVALALAIAGPATSGVTFAAANALVVVYPEWAGRSPTSSSPLERLGGPSLAGIVATLVSTIALVPAALAGAVVGAVAWTAAGTWALTAGAAAGVATLAVEVAIAVPLLGRAFERLDLSD